METIIEIKPKIENLTDLIENIIMETPIKGVDQKILNNILEPLLELDKLIGLENVKKHIFQRVIYHLTFGISKDEYLNTVIYGIPGLGKTEISKIMAKLFCKLGILKTSNIITAKRDDFIAKYLGQTAHRTRDLLNNALDGVLLLDEAYSLGVKNTDNDSFSVEAINYLNQFISENNNRIMVIIAGYEENIKNSFFSINQGLESRFPYTITIEKYKAEEIYQIFCNFCYKNNFKLDGTITPEFFKINYHYFPAFGRSICTFFSKCKICCSVRKFNKKHKSKILSLIDLENALKNMEKKEKEILPYFI